LPSIVNSPGLSPVAKEDAFRPVANVLEGAKLQGKATGIIATSPIQHATPAGFSAHSEHREYYDIIAEQQVYQGIDVVLGGGKEALIPGETKRNRKDGENLVDVIKQKGYTFVETREALMNAKGNKIWGAFAYDAMAYDFDRPHLRPEEPTLAEMTKKAIDVLSKDKDGFFLFVEGSKPDWAAHANDAIGIISDVLAFDAAVKEVLDFAKKDGQTLVIAVSDHGNSGITIGNVNTNKTYSSLPISAYIEPLKKAKMTLEGATSKLKSDLSNIEEVAALYGLDHLTAEEKAQLKAAKDKAEVSATLVKLLANRANIGFTTGGHTGEDVFLYSYGPERPMGTLDNTDIAKVMAKAMRFDLQEVTQRLFINAFDSVRTIGASAFVDETDQENPTLIIRRGTVEAKIPVNKNIMVVNGKTYEIPGVAVYTGGKFWIPRQAINTLFSIKNHK
jgi:alkaline phosphatase